MALSSPQPGGAQGKLRDPGEGISGIGVENQKTGMNLTGSCEKCAIW